MKIKIINWKLNTHNSKTGNYIPVTAKLYFRFMPKKTRGKVIKLTRAILHAKIRAAEKRMDKELAKPSMPHHYIDDTFLESVRRTLEIEMRNP
jgi:hypothetical protein